VYDVVMISRINSKGSYGNDYVLANTTISTALQQLSNSIYTDHISLAMLAIDASNRSSSSSITVQ